MKSQRVRKGSSVRSAMFIVKEAVNDSSSVRDAILTLRPYGTGFPIVPLTTNIASLWDFADYL
jgi:hypothetical protein